MIQESHNKLPNLFIPGAGKSGTSTLHILLNQHPDICMSTMKEPHFWTNPKLDIAKNLQEYLDLFEEKDKKYLGESSTGYMCFPFFIKRIKEHYPTTPKFIFILRNPIDRLYSHYWWLKGIGSENLSLKKAISNDFNIAPNQDLKLAEGAYKMYYQFGLYGKWIQRFYNEFNASNIHIITTEDLANNQTETLNSCFTFLGLKNIASETIKEKSNSTKILKLPFLYKVSKKLAFNEYGFKKVLKPFFPEKTRRYINENIHTFIYKLTATSKEYPTITKEERLWLKSLYEEDVKLLKTVTNKNFNEWQDFN
ncbi:sulfotransferase family protein [Neptunitalea lumnitzerae]|uniref:Sulfotransferase domain-containing protein n=1 Tax=Neptunitalea lumnitzerae TaxID=2965509 RepID=A0ABQ5MM27_9FLAO|nr:sulfotransferase [Neptunitalea sp. Y10]GLB50007.1 hypothetical protein Y10_23750 [Neptunitalea sp. Y10]